MPTSVETTNEQTLNLDYQASTTKGVTVVVRMKVSGKIVETLLFTFAHSSGDRTREQTAFNLPVGEILAVNAFIAAPVKRGQAYMTILLERRARSMKRLARGYMYDGSGVELGDNIEPLSGAGFRRWNQDGNDIAGNVPTTINLARSNTRRIIHALLVRYHCSGDTATRILTARLRDVAGTSGPTGFSIDADSWISPALTMTANEEGVLYIGKDGFLSTNAAGTLAYADNTTAPHPLPYTVEDADPADLIVSITDGNANDDYDVFTLVEEWLEV